MRGACAAREIDSAIMIRVSSLYLYGIPFLSFSDDIIEVMINKTIRINANNKHPKHSLSLLLLLLLLFLLLLLSFLLLLLLLLLFTFADTIFT